MALQIQIRRDTADNWANNSPVLAEGELGYETDTGKLKIGDGTTDWNNLPYTGNDKEDKSNKSTDINLGTSDILYPTQNAVKTYVDNGLSAKANLSGGNTFTGNQTIGSSSSNANLSIYGNTYIKGNFRVSYDKGYMKTLEYNDDGGGYYGITNSLGTSTIDVNGDTYRSYSNMYQWITTGKQSQFTIWHYPVKNGSIQDYHMFFVNIYDFNTSSFKTCITDDLGIGTQNPRAKLEIGGNGEGIILTSSGGNSFKITVDDNGNLTTTAV